MMRPADFEHWVYAKALRSAFWIHVMRCCLTFVVPGSRWVPLSLQASLYKLPQALDRLDTMSSGAAIIPPRLQ